MIRGGGRASCRQAHAETSELNRDGDLITSSSAVRLRGSFSKVAFTQDLAGHQSVAGKHCLWGFLLQFSFSFNKLFLTSIQLHHWSQDWRDQCLPLHIPLWGCWSLQWGLPSVSSRLNRLSDLTRSSYPPLKAFHHLCALLWTLTA